MLITTKEAKKLLKIADDDISNDDFLEIAIPEVEGIITKYCKTDFKDENGEENYPPGLKMVAADMLGYKLNKLKANGLKSQKLDDYSETYSDVVTGSGGYPAEIWEALSEYKVKKIKFY